jgi:predicted acyl esterase
MVQVQSSWFPVTDRNPQRFVESIPFAKPEDFQPATQRIGRSIAEPSRLEVLVLE